MDIRLFVAPKFAQRALHVGAHCGERRVSQLSPDNHDHVKRTAARPRCAIGLLVPEDLAQSSLRTIPDDCAADFAGRDDAESIALAIVRPADERHVARGHAPPASLYSLKLDVRSQASSRRKSAGHVREPSSVPRPGFRDATRLRNCQTLAAFGAAPLENDPAVLGPHPHEKSVRSAAAAAIGLKRALHGAPGWMFLHPAKKGS